MMFATFFAFLSVFVLYPWISAATLNKGPLLADWQPTCEACAPVEKLRASAFGIELAPDYIVIAAKFSNGTLAPMLHVEPECGYWSVMVDWMRKAQYMCAPSNPPFDWLVNQRIDAETVKNELSRVMNQFREMYAGIDLEFASIALPEYVLQDSQRMSIIEDAVNMTGILTSKNADHFNIYPTDAAVALATSLGEDVESSPFTSGFDALVVTNVTAALKASWYQFSWMQSSLGQVIESLAAPHACNLYSKDLSRPMEERLAGIRDFVYEKEKTSDNTGLGSRLMTGDTRLILRLESSDDDEVLKFGRELNHMLQGTRFDPAKTTTTVYRDEGNEWRWSAAKFAAFQTKKSVNSSLPLGCSQEHQVCKDLSECVQREALGELIICEDVEIPQQTTWERIDAGAQAGMWDYYRDNVWSWTSLLTNEFEALLWLAYCKEGMPWSTRSSKERCADAILPLPGNENRRGVLVDRLGALNTIQYAVTRYWLSSRFGGLTVIPSYWFGFDNILKVVAWVVSKVVGRGNFDQFIQRVEAWWETNGKSMVGNLLGEEVLEGL